MVFAVHTRITLSGVLGSASPAPEAFSFGVSMDNISFAPGVDSAPVKAACDAYFGAAGTRINAAATLSQIKIATIGVDGKYVGDPVVIPTLVSGATGVPPHPFQCSLAVSLGTGQRGRTKRGRFYLPLPSVPVSAVDGTIQDFEQSGIEGTTVTFLRALRAAGTQGPGVIVIASRKGYNTPVTRVRVGRVIDTIRTRRRSLSEAYDAGTLF